MPEPNSAVARSPSERVVARPAVPNDDVQLVQALRSGDESAFAGLVDTYHPGMLRMAMLYVRDRAVAEEVAQEAWIGVLRGLDRFELRSTLKTWIFRILLNVARTRAARERRCVPFSALYAEIDGDSERAVDADRFWPIEAPRWPGGWVSIPSNWGNAPEERLISGETERVIALAIQGLSPGQREVVTLRDVNGWSAEEVCNVLQISETNQRVLLHRGRSRVRRELERYLTGS